MKHFALLMLLSLTVFAFTPVVKETKLPDKVVVYNKGVSVTPVVTSFEVHIAMFKPGCFCSLWEQANPFDPNSHWIRVCVNSHGQVIAIQEKSCNYCPDPPSPCSGNGGVE